MPDIHVDYDEINTRCTTMGNKLSDISTELTNLETTVAGLLHDGLVFEKASPALRDAYNTFSSQMKTSAKNIQEYANNFKLIASSLSDSDSKLTTDIRAAIDKMNADAAAAASGHH